MSASNRNRGYSNPQESRTNTSNNRPLLSGGGGGSRDNLRTPSSIRIRRLPSSNSVRPLSQTSETGLTEGRDFAEPGSAGRRRSSSAPQRPTLQELGQDDLTRQRTAEPFMPPIVEGQASAAQEARGLEPVPSRETDAPQPYGNLSRSGTNASDVGGAQAMNSAANTARTNRGLRRLRSGALPPRQQELAADREYDADVVSLLDLVDPEVQTLGTLTNMQNSLFVPDLGRLVNRKPTYDLTKRPGTGYGLQDKDGTVRIPRPRAGTRASTATAPSVAGGGDDVIKPTDRPGTDMGVELGTEDSQGRRNSVSSQLTESHYAVLPHGVRLEGWSEEDLDELNDYVRHLLHSRREGFKRSMRGFGKYVSKPLGLFVTVYAVLVTLFGAAWVFCLIGWIYVDGQQEYIINIIDLTLVALFALMGDGLAPFRAVDTYHMCYIAKYAHKTWEIREKQQLPKLEDHNDLPGRRSSAAAEEPDLENNVTKADKNDRYEYTVLSPVQQRRLQYHQAKFAKTHTFYKPHETATHHAFPLRLLIAIVVLLDFHSIFQVALGTCTWTIPYQVRPAAVTAVILSCSLTCNIVAGILISVGDKRTRKKDVLERIFRQDLTKEAIKKIQHRHERADDAENLGVDVDDEARFGDVEGIELSRKSMEAKREMEARKPRKSLDVRRTKMGATGLLSGKEDEVDGRVHGDKAGGVGRTSMDGRRASVDPKGRVSIDRKAGSRAPPSQQGGESSEDAQA